MHLKVARGPPRIILDHIVQTRPGFRDSAALQETHIHDLSLIMLV